MYMVYDVTQKCKRNWIIIMTFKNFFFVFLRRNLENERKNLENIGTY